MYLYTKSDLSNVIIDEKRQKRKEQQQQQLQAQQQQQQAGTSGPWLRPCAPLNIGTVRDIETCRDGIIYLTLTKYGSNGNDTSDGSAAQ